MSQVTALTTLVSFMNPYCRMGGTELVASVSYRPQNSHGRADGTAFRRM